MIRARSGVSKFTTHPHPARSGWHPLPESAAGPTIGLCACRRQGYSGEGDERQSVKKRETSVCVRKNTGEKKSKSRKTVWLSHRTAVSSVETSTSSSHIQVSSPRRPACRQCPRYRQREPAIGQDAPEAASSTRR